MTIWQIIWEALLWFRKNIRFRNYSLQVLGQKVNNELEGFNPISLRKVFLVIPKWHFIREIVHYGNPLENPGTVRACIITGISSSSSIDSVKRQKGRVTCLEVRVQKSYNLQSLCVLFVEEWSVWAECWKSIYFAACLPSCQSLHGTWDLCRRQHKSELFAIFQCHDFT